MCERTFDHHSPTAIHHHRHSPPPPFTHHSPPFTIHHHSPPPFTTIIIIIIIITLIDNPKTVQSKRVCPCVRARRRRHLACLSTTNNLIGGAPLRVVGRQFDRGTNKKNNS
jgi:hypothetical protein